MNPFGFLCLSVFLQKLKSSACMLEGKYSPSWAWGHPTLAPPLGVHSIHREEPPSKHFLPFSKSRKADAHENPQKTEVKGGPRKFRVTEGCRQHGLETLLHGASPRAALEHGNPPLLGTTDTENGAPCTREGLVTSSFCPTEALFCSSSSSS